jgi:hypothetical protein
MVKCFVVGCFTGYKSAKEKYAKVFKPPKRRKAIHFMGKENEKK